MSFRNSNKMSGLPLISSMIFLMHEHQNEALHHHHGSMHISPEKAAFQAALSSPESLSSYFHGQVCMDMQVTKTWSTGMSQGLWSNILQDMDARYRQLAPTLPIHNCNHFVRRDDVLR